MKMDMQAKKELAKFLNALYGISGNLNDSYNLEVLLMKIHIMQELIAKMEQNICKKLNKV